MTKVKRGDIIVVNLNPIKGHEQMGLRPCLVISHSRYNEKTGMVIICPITSKNKGYVFEIPLKTKKVSGFVLANQIRTIDTDSKERKVRVVDSANDDVLQKVINTFKLIVD